jgi:serine/threonine protein kinase
VSTTSLIGRMLGKTHITDLLGRGGMATVYKGYQADIDRYVAVKVLPQMPEQDGAFVERFKLEARTIARLQHPHILPVYDFGDENGLLYLVTAYAPGGSLSDMIAKSPLTLTQAERLLREVAPALDYAHRQGIIHRDIKPANILLDREGNALLADFGIVKLIESSTVAGLTNASGVVGTPAYMAPEQANGLPVDGRTDIYALGVVAYEMLTGKQPFAAETPLQLLLKHMTQPPPLLRDSLTGIPPALDVVLQRVLAKEQDERYQTATQFAQAFAQAISNAETGTLQMPLVQTGASIPTPMSTSVIPPTGATLPPIAPMPSQFATNAANTPPPTQAMPIPGGRGQSWLLTIIVAGAAVLALGVALFALATTNQRAALALPTETLRPTPTALVAAVPTTPLLPSFGSASFATTDSLGDTLNLRVEDLAPLPPGARYEGWLSNTDTEAVISIGSVNVDVLGSGQLSYVDADGANLPTLYNRIWLTQESDDDDQPDTTARRYVGTVPIAVTNALREILTESEAGFNGGSLLDGALIEARIGKQHSGYAASARNLSGLRLHAEHTINIYLGASEDYDGDGRGNNPGRGVGVDFFLTQIEERLVAAAEDAADDPQAQTQIEYIRVCLVNVRGWMDEIIAIEQSFIAAADIESVEADTRRSTEVADALIEGIDLNGNGSVELFEGECGLQQIGESGILVGNLTLREGESS